MVTLRLPSPGEITSPFGERPGGFHEGIDFGWGRGWGINAAAAGTVRHAGPGGAYGARYGYLTIIDHKGFQTRYGHQSRQFVRPGVTVAAGDDIGIIGGSGARGLNTYDPHLHFELLINGRKVNPFPYFTTTAADDITPIILKELEQDMIKLYNHERADASGRRHALVGEFTFQPLSLSAAQEEWKRDGEVVGVSQAEWDRYEARTKARRAEMLAAIGQPAVDYDELAKSMAKLEGQSGATKDDVEAAASRVIDAIPTGFRAVPA